MSTAAEDTGLEARYRSRLTAYLGCEAEEAELTAALELGRMALAEGHGLLDLLGIHQALMADLIHHSSNGADILLLLNRANEFLTQAAAPFEMAHRGWRDMADRLRLANEVLEQRVAERTTAHREAVERLDRAQQIAGIGSWELDLKTGRQTWSKEMHRICGLGDELPLSASNNIFSFIHEEDRDLHEQWFAQLQSGYNPGAVEHRIRLPNGHHRLVRADGEVIAEAEGTVSKICGTLQDITERKAAEAQLHELQAELAHFSRLNTIGHMASGLAHELNQPLSAIANYLKGCVRLLGNSSDEQLSALRHALDKAGEQAMRAGQIVRRLRDFMAHHETDFLIESIKTLVEETSSLALVGMKEGIQIRFSFDPGVDHVLVDKIQIQQVLLNLSRNAVEAMQASEQRKLTISTKMDQRGMVLISVADTGPGIDADMAEKLFQPFVTSKQDGMGVGLSICRTIVESHGGRIWFDPNPGGGTIFRFTLRAVSAVEMGEATETNAAVAHDQKTLEG